MWLDLEKIFWKRWLWSLKKGHTSITQSRHQTEMYLEEAFLILSDKERKPDFAELVDG